MVRRLVLALAVAGAASLPACSHGDDGAGAPASAVARIATDRGPVTLHVAVADTDAARERGLQGVTRLAADGGVAFEFDSPTRVGFWMKDTPLPLSIAFWGSDGRIVAMLDMPPCAADPCPTYRPGSDFVGALEARMGFFAGHGVKIGDRVAVVR
jgi:uncharacterized protein